MTDTACPECLGTAPADCPVCDGTGRWEAPEWLAWEKHAALEKALREIEEKGGRG